LRSEPEVINVKENNLGSFKIIELKAKTEQGTTPLSDQTLGLPDTLEILKRDWKTFLPSRGSF